MKNQTGLSRLLNYAGKFKYFTYASWILTAISAILGLLPFFFIWKIVQEVLIVSPNYSNATHIVENGWYSVIFAGVSLVVYILGLICSHVSAFRIARNMRKVAIHHIAKLPLGFMDSFGSGKMRKIIDESTASTETYLAHQLPDRSAALMTPIGLIVMMLYFDWRMGIFTLIPVFLAFLTMLSMTGNSMQNAIREYQNALDNMSNEAVEYIRGIPVVKTFGQTVFSFKRFELAINLYKEWVVAYTKKCRFPMVLYTTIINSVFAFIIAAGFYFIGDSFDKVFLSNVVFYIIITPVIGLTLTKILFFSENGMLIKVYYILLL